jgi:hypothetical protein
MNDDSIQGQGGRSGDVAAAEQVAKEILEKRRYERMRAGLQIKYRVVGPTEEATLVKQGGYAAPEVFKANTPEIYDFHKVVTENVSLGGVRISTPMPLPEGTRLWLQVSIPNVPIPVDAIGEVRWSRQVGSLCSSGLKFLSISKTDLEKVERFLVLQKRAEFEKRG